MVTDYIFTQLKKAKYKKLADETYFGEIPGLRGVWANAKTLVACKKELREVLEEWLAFPVQPNRNNVVSLTFNKNNRVKSA